MATDSVKPKDNPPVLVEPTTNRDGVALDAATNTQVILLGRNPTDGRVDTFDPADGVYGYKAGTAAGTVDVPASARLRRVSVIANAAAVTTVTIGGGDTITIPIGGTFDEQVPGLAVGADVVIAGGAPQSYYVSWVA